MGKQFFTSKEATRIIGCSIRQLQYWRDKGVVVPTISGTGTGRSIYYNYSDLVDLAIMKHGLDMGLSFDTARKCLAQLRDGQPDYINPETKTQLMLYWNRNSESLTLAEYDRDSAIALLEQGKLVIPLRLTEIHYQLINKLKIKESNKFNDQQDSEDKTELSKHQRNLVNESIADILKGQKQLLVGIPPGSGKTQFALDICWKLFQMKWNIKGENRSPRILCLADRHHIVDNYIDRFTNVFNNNTIYKINEKANKGRKIYFATYQDLVKDTSQTKVYQAYRPDYFDFIIFDTDQQKQEYQNQFQPILEYFEFAYQLALISTSLLDKSNDISEYFGNPINSDFRE
jgi:DNA-binding transcriptional MerR regulator